MKIRIPERHKKTLINLIKLSGEAKAKLIDLLQKESQVFSYEKTAIRIAPQIGLEINKTTEIVEMLGTMYSARTRLKDTAEMFLTEIYQSLEDPEYKEILSKEELALSRDYIIKLLESTQALGMLSKASYLVSRHENVYCDAQILSDARPVFGSDANEPPSAMVITHNLKIRYHTSDFEETKEIYLAMDRDDIESFIKIFERARIKDKSLKDLLNSTTAKVLDLGSH